MARRAEHIPHPTEIGMLGALVGRPCAVPCAVPVPWRTAGRITLACVCAARGDGRNQARTQHTATAATRHDTPGLPRIETVPS